MFDTVIGVHYLRARSLYFQATGRHSEALLDCRSCGELLARWGMEAPAFAPWRSDAAVSALWLGRQQEAHQLAEEQLALTGPAQQRTRGISLRAVAATRPVDERAAPLNEAITALRACGDRLELTQALVDLADARRQMGEPASAVVQEAADLSAACGVPLPSPTGRDHPEGTTQFAIPGQRQAVEPRAAEHPIGPSGALSEAERRVAELASSGHTNRQIADELFVTVSTVEQHLTRTYRKLQVSRTQLGAALALAPATRSAVSA
jgi:DNA-binding CsgD family transcriptional regulator